MKKPNKHAWRAEVLCQRLSHAQDILRIMFRLKSSDNVYWDISTNFQNARTNGIPLHSRQDPKYARSTFHMFNKLSLNNVWASSLLVSSDSVNSIQALFCHSNVILLGLAEFCEIYRWNFGATNETYKYIACVRRNRCTYTFLFVKYASFPIRTLSLKTSLFLWN